MKIRRMNADDSESVSSIEKKYFSVPWSEESVRESCNNENYICFVAEKEEKKVVGYCIMNTVLEEGNITNIVVECEFRNKGIAEKLLNYLIEEARLKGIIVIFLEVRRGNEIAISLYNKMGFKVIGERKNFYDKPREDAWIMEKRL